MSGHKRTWIPTLDGKLRPLGIAALRTRLSNGPFGRSWNASTKRTFWVSVTAIVPDEAVAEPWTRSARHPGQESELDTGCGQLPRNSIELDPVVSVPYCDPANLVTRATAQVAARPPDDLGQIRNAQPSVATNAESPASRSPREVRSSLFKVRAVYSRAARTDLCGGRSAMTVSTAITFSSTRSHSSRG